MDNPLDGLVEIVAVADAGGFSAAARRLGTSKSVVSERISRLEARLGARLFHRTTRRLALTEAGQVCYEHGRRILDEAARAEGELAALGGEPRGQVRVTASVQFAGAHLAPMLPALRERHPHVTVDIIATDAVTDLAGEGVDVAVRFMGRREGRRVAGRVLAPLRYLLCAAPAYLERRGTPSRPEDLARHDCLLFRASPGWDEWSFRRPAAAEGAPTARVRAAGPVCSDSGIVLREAAIAGMGVAQLSTVNAAEALRSGRLVRVLTDWPLAGLEDRALWAVYTGSGAVPPKARAFVEFLAERVGDPPYWDRGL
jgi:DNA-binding transcriptional LysR family regulator